MARANYTYAYACVGGCSVCVMGANVKTVFASRPRRFCRHRRAARYNVESIRLVVAAAAACVRCSGRLRFLSTYNMWTNAVKPLPRAPISEHYNTHEVNIHTNMNARAHRFDRSRFIPSFGRGQ